VFHDDWSINYKYHHNEVQNKLMSMVCCILIQVDGLLIMMMDIAQHISVYKLLNFKKRLCVLIMISADLVGKGRVRC
jgi:hypothetical protein